MLERFNEEIKRRTIILRIFPNEESCLRLIRALAYSATIWMRADCRGGCDVPNLIVAGKGQSLT